MNVSQSLFVLADPSKCSGCRACEIACHAGHLTEKTMTVGNLSAPVTPRLFLARGAALCMPVQCHHCEDAPCIRSCQCGALFRSDGGAVVLDDRRCIGCRNCALVCPFGAIEIFSLSELHGGCGVPKLVYKCDLCSGKKEHACVAACPNGALRPVDPESEISAKRIAALSADGAASQGRML